MLKRAALSLSVLLLGACQPEAAPPAAPEATAEGTVTDVQSAADPAAPADVAAPAGEIVVTSPLPGARVMSPLIIEGSADNTWFFEGQFVAELVMDGKVMIQAPAMQHGDKAWTDPGPVGFRAEMKFSVSERTNAEIVLSEDMPALLEDGSDERGPPRTIRIPVVLLPASR